MDGNGRWAKAQRKLRIQGHREGAKNIRTLTTFASDLGIEILTLYAFSKENWSRPKAEVDLLMKLLKLYAIRERGLFMKNNVQMKVIGDLSQIPAFARKELDRTIELTSKNTGMILQLALNYGSRDEMVRATKKIAAEVAAGRLKPEEIDENRFADFLDTAHQPDPDLLIRTSGELRISNYLLWQCAYAEFYFTEKFWPEFTEKELMKAIEAYQKRERRFGGISSRKTMA
ncbi:MAG: isoprenyl transferase [Deltaproteobacteria bacterium]|nr:isoprenyl transferase [Deltaproteobacteria bacterium]